MNEESQDGWPNEESQAPKEGSGVKENLQGWRLPLQVILYLSFPAFVNQSFL
jgi:hypothetical protein